MTDVFLIISACMIFLLAGITKGIVGGGLPVLSIGLLTTMVGLQEAIAIAVIPAFVTNFWQASQGGYFKELIARLWPYLLISIGGVIVGTMLLVSVNSAVLTIILGLVISIYSFLGAFGIEFKIDVKWESIAGPVFGFATGLIGGMTGSPAYPGLYFLNGLGFNRNKLVQAMGICFSIVTLSVALSMKSSSLINLQQFTISVIVIAPAMVGMIIGAKFRHSMSEDAFKKFFYIGMGLLGIYLIVRSFIRLG